MIIILNDLNCIRLDEYVLANESNYTWILNVGECKVMV
jgi:hypothetical protein